MVTEEEDGVGEVGGGFIALVVGGEGCDDFNTGSFGGRKLEIYEVIEGPDGFLVFIFPVVIVSAVVVEDGEEGLDTGMTEFHVDGCWRECCAGEPGFVGDVHAGVGEFSFLASE